MPNNRQWASMIWITALLIWFLLRADLRSSVRDVLRTALSPKILGPLAVFVVWILGLLHLASQVGLWDADRVADTAFWFVAAGLILFGRFDEVGKEPHFVRRTALATLEVSAMAQVLSEVFVLNLVVELILQPVFALFGGVSVVAAQKSEHRSVKRLVDGVLLAGSVGLLVYVLVSLVNNWGSVEKRDLLQQFALPVWLTVGVLPYIYVLGLFAAYELAFMRIDWKSEAGWWARTRAKLVLVTSFRTDAGEVRAFSGPWQFELAAVTSFRDGRRVVREFREAQQEIATEVEEKAARLVRFAGVEGVDEDGRQLDRREFEETCEALRWVATCQMGWYRNNQAGGYRDDLLDFVLDGFAARRLPEPHGVQMRVAENGQKWYAWRRTVGGWVFAIGAAGPPPDQWEYDGREPPTGFPGGDSTWGTTPFGLDANVNW